MSTCTLLSSPIFQTTPTRSSPPSKSSKPFHLKLARCRACLLIRRSPWDQRLKSSPNRKRQPQLELQSMSDKINLSRRHLLGTAIMTVAGAQLGAMASAKSWFGGGSELGSLAHATAWLNSPPLTAAEL